MDTYSFLRELADSWVLLLMFAYFIGAGIWAFLPSQAQAREDASMIPLRDENDADVAPIQTGASEQTRRKD
ncbi:MAG: cytochrome c oxidase cbb3-type subunit 4 [Ascidiaceihabitans sp.]|jgi:cytochrome c oxidase cbb3-type subunit 4|tara:strand:+ start:3628 stop:3840 length:213 start_codon:yes stop_codon:yes gene_type:complete